MPRALITTVAICLTLSGTANAETLRIGYAEVDLTPEIRSGKGPVWIAGYGYGRTARGVHDPIMGRCLVLRSGEERIAIASLDLIGLQFEAVRAIREKLPEFRHVTVSSTHNHEGPDVIGIWGPSPFQSGVDAEYVASVISKTADMIRRADQETCEATGVFGTAEDPKLMDDARLPIVKDAVIRVVRFDDAVKKRPAALLVQWSCHPESLGPRNRKLTADFPAATVQALREKYDCPVLYVTGAVGGLMTNPAEGITNERGEPLDDQTFEYMEAYGRSVAKLAEQAVAKARPLRLTPFAIESRAIFIPVENKLYRLARILGVVKRPTFEWSGDPLKPGAKIEEHQPGRKAALESEVSCLRLGELQIANIPGELYPELVYKAALPPAPPEGDFPEAPAEPSVEGSLGDSPWMIFGLANDEIGYLLPKRQWDAKPPYAYGKEGGQYGEINSCGPDSAAIVLQALAECAAAVRSRAP